MTTKRKLMTAVASLGVLIILAGVALGMALAALTGKVTSGFTINYTAKNVSAAISGSWGYNTNAMKTMMSGEDNKIIFTGSETSGSEAQKGFDNLGDIALSGTNQEVTFRYRFLNFDEKGNDIPLSMTLSGDMENLDISYTVTTFNGQTTSTTSDKTTNLPLSLSATVPYIGMETSFDELYEYALSQLGELGIEFGLNPYVFALAYLIFTQGEEAAFQTFSELDGINELSEWQLFETARWACTINCIRIHLEESKEQALEYIDGSLFPTLAKASGGFEYYSEEITKDVLFGIYFGYDFYDCIRKGEYIEALNSALGYFTLSSMDLGEGFYHETLFEREVAAQNVMYYNIYDEYLKNGYQKAADLIDVINERNSFYFWGGNIDNLKAELAEYDSLGESGKIAAQQKQNEYKEEIESFAQTEHYDEEIFQFLILAIYCLQDPVRAIVESGMVPYTEVIVTISLSDETDNAYLKTGNFEFILG